MTEQQIANRAWLLAHRRWLRFIEITHQRRAMENSWRWLYADLVR